ncbi:hypothetical protein [Egbenema bharatensis]
MLALTVQREDLPKVFLSNVIRVFHTWAKLASRLIRFDSAYLSFD